jgi:hypothetical protein
MRHRSPWDLEEATQAKAMRLAKVPIEEVARRLGRNVPGVERALHRFFGPEARLALMGYEVGPAIAKTKECVRLQHDAENGSRALGAALNEFLARMDPAEREFCLGAGRQQIPGTERIYKTSSVERMAA